MLESFVIAAELAWLRRHMLPWLGRHVRARSSGDDRACKRPTPTAVELPATG